MVVIDHELCAYCGGCVSVCPQGALKPAFGAAKLREMRVCFLPQLAWILQHSLCD